MSTAIATQNAPAPASQAVAATATQPAAGGEKPGSTPAQDTPKGATSPTSVMGGTAPAQDGAKPGEQGQADGAPKGDAPAPTGELEIKLPDGVQVDTAMLDGFKAVAKEVGLDSEKATKLAAFYVAKQAEANEAGKEAWKQQGQAWLKEIQADKVLGGDNFATTSRFVDKALTQHGTPELRQRVIEMGLDNWPPFVRLLRSVGLSSAEDDSAAGGGGGGAPANDRAAQLRAEYPSMTKKE